MTNVNSFDVSEHLDSPELMAEYLNVTIESGSPELLYRAIGNIAKAKGMTNTAKETGLGRESLYKSLSGTGSPKFSAMLKVISSFGLEVDFKPKRQHV